MLNATFGLYTMNQPGQNSEIKYKIAKFDPGAQNVNRKNLTNRTLLSSCPDHEEILTRLGTILVSFLFFHYRFM